MTPISEVAKGRWRGILPGLGVASSYLTGKHGPCPICKDGKDRFRFDDKDGRGSYFCSRCLSGDGVKLVQLVNGWDFKEAAAEIERVAGTAKVETSKVEDPEAKKQEMNALWKAGVGLSGAAERYLLNRCGSLPRTPDLRFLPSCRYDAFASYPALLGLIRTREGRPTCLHRTYLADDGHKALVDPARKMLGPMPEGAALRLFPAGPVMGVAEGIETALSASAMFDVPVWAAINDDRLLKWTPPAECREVMIFADHDASFAGQTASYGLAKRLKTAGLIVRVELPPRMGEDWNDVHSQSERPRKLEVVMGSDGWRAA